MPIPFPEEITLDSIREVERQIHLTQMDIESLQRRITRIRANCQHQWSEPEQRLRYETILVSGDPVMHGVDQEYPLKAESKGTLYFERVCLRCGEVQETTETTTISKKVPKF